MQSEDEFTQHTDDAAFERGVELALNRDGIASPWVGEWYEARSIRNARSDWSASMASGDLYQRN